ncbi:MAG: hypothetical protein LBS83_00450 [Holosporales bacterium]|jgi:hypothetical protein|nr:hypothetical protein [Holosporales bacterium]
MEKFYKTTVLVSLLGISNFSYGTLHGTEAMGQEMTQPKGVLGNLLKRGVTFCSNAFGRLCSSLGNPTEREANQLFTAVMEGRHKDVVGLIFDYKKDKKTLVNMKNTNETPILNLAVLGGDAGSFNS